MVRKCTCKPKKEKIEDKKIINKTMLAIRKSTLEGDPVINLPSGQGWRKEYGYDYNTGNYWTQGYGHSGHSTTGWHDQQATIYTPDEMKIHIHKKAKLFKKALQELERNK